MPFYDQAWYEWKKSTTTPEQFAQEIEINYAVAIVGRVYPDWKDPIVKHGG
jgi:hypothetical protein